MNFKQQDEIMEEGVKTIVSQEELCLPGRLKCKATSLVLDKLKEKRE